MRHPVWRSGQGGGCAGARGLLEWTPRGSTADGGNADRTQGCDAGGARAWRWRLALALPARAQSVIRDAEIEGTIRQIADPIFTAARLDKDSIKIYILSDDKLNSFVAGGQNLFLNTGLLIRGARTATSSPA